MRSLAKVATQTHHDYYRYFDATGATDFVRLIMNDEPIRRLLIETAYPMRATITLSHEQLQYQYEGVLNSLEKTHQIKKIIILLLMMVKKMDACPINPVCNSLFFLLPLAARQYNFFRMPPATSPFSRMLLPFLNFISQSLPSCYTKRSSFIYKFNCWFKSFIIRAKQTGIPGCRL